MGTNARIPLATGPRAVPISGRPIGISHPSILCSHSSHLGGRPQAASLVRGESPRNAPLGSPPCSFFPTNMFGQQYSPQPLRQGQALCLHSRSPDQLTPCNAWLRAFPEPLQDPENNLSHRRQLLPPGCSRPKTYAPMPPPSSPLAPTSSLQL